MERITENPGRAVIEERIAKVVRDHAAADRRFRHVAEHLDAAFWTFVTLCLLSLAVFFLSIALRG